MTIEVRKPILLRVRLAFGSYPVGYIFKSPPLAGTLRQDLLSKGFLEVIDEVVPEKSEPKRKKVR